MRIRMRPSLIVIAIPFLCLLWIAFNSGISKAIIPTNPGFYGAIIAILIVGSLPAAWLLWRYLHRAVKSQAFLKSAPLLMHQAFIEDIKDENEDSYWDVFYADVSDHNDD
jgi:hypothetical protein